MKVLDLFSGIGGFSFGLEQAGFETIAFCEIDPYCRQLLKQNFPGVPIYEDIRNLQASDLDELPDIITGGYPCQPFSLAGKRGGEEDDRHVWPEMYRLIRDIRPRWVIAENVAGHISMGLDSVLSDLEDEDYTWWTFVIPACAVDAKHRRDRVWILANTVDKQCNTGSQTTRRKKRQITSGRCEGTPYVANSNCKREPQSQGLELEKRERVSDSSETIPNTNSKRSPQREVFARGKSKTRRAPSGPTFEGAGRWPVEPGICRVVNGLPNRVDRIKVLGNAVVPQLAEILGQAILMAEQH